MKKEIIKQFNHLFFTERSLNNHLNMTFWQKIDDLDRYYPDINFVIKLVLRKDKRFNRFYQDVLFECESPEFLKQANDIYQDHFHIVFLELYEDSKEINDELMKDVLH